MTEFLALMHVGDVYLDYRWLERVQRIENGDRIVGERGRVDHDSARNLTGFIDPVHDLVFAVALMEAKLKLELFRYMATVGLDISQSLVAIDVRLALTEQIKVGAVQDKNKTVHSGPLFSELSVMLCSFRG